MKNPEKGKSRTGRLWRRLAASAAIAFLAAGQIAADSATATREYDLKAAFLYNFATFVDWPGRAFAKDGSPFVIGIIGPDPFGAALRQITNGEHIKGRAIAIRQCAKIDDIAGCQILFINASEKRRLTQILQQCREQPVLTVADMPGFIEAGGQIAFITDTRVGIRINPAALRNVNLAISSKLIRLAQVVEPATPPP